jgi:UDP-2,3-diacylglucosamine hydrolase
VKGSSVTLAPFRPTASDAPLGLLAGWGRFPLVVARKARELGKPVFCVGIKHEASAELATLAEGFAWSGVAKLGRTIRLFKKAGCRHIVMAGKIHKHRFLYAPWRLLSLVPDLRCLRFWYRRHFRDRKDDTLLLAMIDEYQQDGLEFGSALDFYPELLAPEGLLTRRRPTHSEQADIEFGWSMAKEMGRLDVGQSVCVKEGAVLAVEAIEGTDSAIRRAGALCPAGGFAVVKVAKPQQDMRFDVPTVGLFTIDTLLQAGAKVLAIEAGRTILLDREQVIAMADRYGLTIVARREAAAVRLAG